MKKFNLLSKLDSWKARAGAGVVGFGTLGAGAAFADGPDVSAAVAVIATVAVAAGAIGVASLSMTAGVKLFKWIKGAM